jgi:hypothetical protein
VEIALQHHQEIREGIDCVGVCKVCILLVLFEVGDPEGFDDSLDNLRLTGQHEFLEHHSHGIIQRQTLEIHLTNVVLSNLTCELVDVSNQLTYVGQIQAFKVLMDEGCDFLSLLRQETLFN